jgi:hypothetical protein
LPFLFSFVFASHCLGPNVLSHHANDFFPSVNTFTAPLITLYYLARHPYQQATLYASLSLLLTAGSFDMRHQHPLLDACVYEAMRLCAVIPHGGERTTPAEGIFIGEGGGVAEGGNEWGRWIPGGVVVRVPMYTICRGKSVRRWQSIYFTYSLCTMDVGLVWGARGP